MQEKTAEDHKNMSVYQAIKIGNTILLSDELGLCIAIL